MDEAEFCENCNTEAALILVVVRKLNGDGVAHGAFCTKCHIFLDDRDV